jgi:hypothetical protein
VIVLPYCFPHSPYTIVSLASWARPCVCVCIITTTNNSSPGHSNQADCQETKKKPANPTGEPLSRATWRQTTPGYLQKGEGESAAINIEERESTAKLESGARSVIHRHSRGSVTAAWLWSYCGVILCGIPIFPMTDFRYRGPRMYGT